MIRTLLACCVICAFALAGCDGGERGSQGVDQTTPAGRKAAPVVGDPVPGDRIVMAAIGEPTNLITPLATDSASHEVASYLYVAPLKYDRDLNVIPFAAESFEALDGGRLLRFKLRENIRWTDGRPLTADDVEFTYRLMIDPKTPTAYAEDFRAVSEFRKTGPYSFEVRYAEPFARAFATWMSDILPKHLLDRENLMDTKFGRSPVGAGPYKLKEWVPGQRLTLEANLDYFEGRPYLDEVIYRIIPDQATQFLELKAGSLDFVNLTPQQYLFQAKGADWERNFRKYQYLSFSYAYVGWNMRSALFQDLRVRRALAHAVDKSEVVKGALLGEGAPTTGPYKPGSWMYDDKIVDYPYDPAAARALLKEAGWEDRDGDGILDKDGLPFSFTILTNQGNDLRIKTATIIQNRLKDVGVDVKVRTMEWAALIKDFVSVGKFDALLLGWNILQDPDLYDVWHSSKAQPGGLNHTAFKNAEADALLEKGRRTLDQAERKKIYDRFQEVLHEEQPYLFLYCPMALPIIQARFQGIEPAPAGITHDFIHWWVPKELQRHVPRP